MHVQKHAQVLLINHNVVFQIRDEGVLPAALHLSHLLGHKWSFLGIGLLLLGLALRTANTLHTLGLVLLLYQLVHLRVHTLVESPASALLPRHHQIIQLLLLLVQHLVHPNILLVELQILRSLLQKKLLLTLVRLEGVLT
jgi:hypothetical protein